MSKPDQDAASTLPTGGQHAAPAGGQSEQAGKGSGDAQHTGTAQGQSQATAAGDAQDAGREAGGDQVLRAQLKAERDKRLAAEKRLEEVEQVDEATRQRREAERAALAGANERILKAEVRMCAKGVLTDPEDALKYLELGGFEVSEDGQVDTGAITAALKDLVAARPYLATRTGTGAFTDTGDGGARIGQSSRSQLTQAQVDAMSPAEVLEARRNGRLDRLMGKTS